MKVAQENGVIVRVGSKSNRSPAQKNKKRALQHKRSGQTRHPGVMCSQGKRYFGGGDIGYLNAVLWSHLGPWPFKE
uniref:Uncharacterized protein n=1 Tax=Oryza meridionalis TaxID=40149 RepID=A0A0E0F064_9ORYZ